MTDLITTAIRKVKKNFLDQKSVDSDTTIISTTKNKDLEHAKKIATKQKKFIDDKIVAIKSKSFIVNVVKRKILGEKNNTDTKITDFNSLLVEAKKLSEYNKNISKQNLERNKELFKYKIKPVS